MKRVEVTKPMVGIFGMQVCACNDATDEEILAVANTDNPAGTSNGWNKVVRTAEQTTSLVPAEVQLPTPCLSFPDRTHFLIFC